MLAGQRRGHYARWDFYSTRILVHLILTEDVLKNKMKSLIDMHHNKVNDRSVHLTYGSVKQYAERIGLARDDSRAISIKMINIVKSFDRKDGLSRLFRRGWQVARQLRAATEARTLGSALAPSRQHDAANQTGPDEAKLNQIIDKINQKVSRFHRRPKARRTPIEPANTQALAGGAGPAQNGRPAPLDQVQNGRRDQYSETLSQQLNPSRDVGLDLEVDAMSRAEYSPSRLVDSSPAEDQDSFLAESTRDELEEARERVEEMRDGEKRRCLRRMVGVHLNYLDDVRSTRTREEVSRLNREFCSLVKGLVRKENDEPV